VWSAGPDRARVRSGRVSRGGPSRSPESRRSRGSERVTAAVRDPARRNGETVSGHGVPGRHPHCRPAGRNATPGGSRCTDVRPRPRRPSNQASDTYRFYSTRIDNEAEYSRDNVTSMVVCGRIRAVRGPVSRSAPAGVAWGVIVGMGPPLEARQNGKESVSRGKTARTLAALNWSPLTLRPSKRSVT
jgi:hypothetical protein